MRGTDHRVHERLRRIEIVTVHADVVLAALHALDGEPVDESGIGIVVQAAQHGAPGFEREFAAVGERTGHALYPRALARVELVGLAFELGPQRLPQSTHRLQHLLQCIGQLVGGLDQPGIERAHVAFLAEALVVAGRPRPHLLAHQGQELLGRTQYGAVGQPRLPVG